jgi:serine/threonine protein phosphatase PrpC
MDYALSSIIGDRENQEDFGAIKSSGDSNAILAVIADGMGGQVAGEVASSSVVNVFVESFTLNPSKNLPLKLSVALEKANRNLAKSIAKNPKLSGMGATLIAAYITPKSINWASVGDSVLYLFRDRKLKRLNQDHSMLPVLQESVRRGKITQDEAQIHPHRNALRSALTGEDIPMVDLQDESLRLQNGDLVVLATDGILTLSEPEIRSVLDRCKAETAQVIASQLMEAVTQINRPRQDNTLVEVIKVKGSVRVSFRWNDVVIAALIFLSAVFLTSFAWEKRETILTWVGSANKQDVSTKRTEISKVAPTPVDDTVSQPENKEMSNEQPQLSKSPALSSADATTATKNGKTNQDKKTPVINKAAKQDINKVHPRQDEHEKQSEPKQELSPPKGGARPTGTVKLDGSEATGTSVLTSSPPAKTDSVQKDEGAKAKLLLEGGNPIRGNSDSERKE